MTEDESRPLIRRRIAIQSPPEDVTSSVGSDDAPQPPFSRNLQPQPLQDTIPGWPPRERVFPDYIDVDYNGFMRAYDPFWQPPSRPPPQGPHRQPTSCMYTFSRNYKGIGNIHCSKRMDQWLQTLPESSQGSAATLSGLRKQYPKEQGQTKDEKKVEGEKNQARSIQQLPASNSRGRSSSAPVPPSNSALELLGPDLVNVLTPKPIGPAPGGPAKSLSGVPVIPPFRHPNPFNQHPVDVDDLPIELQIPERDSSFCRIHRSSDNLNNPPTQAGMAVLTLPPPAVAPAAGAEELISGIKSIKIGNPVQFQGSLPKNHYLDLKAPGVKMGQDQDVAMTDAPAQESLGMYPKVLQSIECDQPIRRPFSTHIQQFFGKESGKENSKKHGRSDTPLTIDTQRAAKRVKDIFGRARDRLSTVVTPSDDRKDGRKSRLGRLASVATSRLGSSSGKKKLTTDFPPNYIPDKIKMVILGDKHSGKTELVERFKAEASINLEGAVHEGYTLHSFSYDVDGERIPLEIRDVSSLCDYSSPADHPRPLLMGYLSIVVICFDIQNEASLQSAIKKWRRVSDEYCDSAPLMLLGLKSDLRPRFPTLKLMHLNEPTAISTGQGEEAANELDAIGYFECSARTGEGVTDFFESVMRFSMERRRQKMAATAPEEKNKMNRMVSKMKAKCRK